MNEPTTEKIDDVLRTVPWPPRNRAPETATDESLATEDMLSFEWLVTNGLGGYCSGTIAGVPTRRYHGLLVAALPAPLGRTVMLQQLGEHLLLPNGDDIHLSGIESSELPWTPSHTRALAEMRLELGIPVWRFEVGGVVLERRVFMPHGQNTTIVSYKLVAAPPDVTDLELRVVPAVHFRSHDAAVSEALKEPYRVSAQNGRYEIACAVEHPVLRMRTVVPAQTPEQHRKRPLITFTVDEAQVPEVLYRTELSRGYESHGSLHRPGHFTVRLRPGSEASLIASTEAWSAIDAIVPDDALAQERDRRRELLRHAHPRARSGPAAELVIAADQFVITPAARLGSAVDAAASLDPGPSRGKGASERSSTVIAGYHWFTDWGRDTMISLEGLTLVTGRFDEARATLRTFAAVLRDGLLPNLFPEHGVEGLYNTADATMWFFHAIDRYVSLTGDRDLLRELLPALREVISHHVRGTRFGIGVDPNDGLLRQGASGYALTWMDAKMGDWIVTPRRGKAVEINALFYNALRLLERWCKEENDENNARTYREIADRVYTSFNARFWFAPGEHLYDVVDGEGGDDSACRPNQVLAVGLTHPVLDPSRWAVVVRAVERDLLTPVGLRSLARSHPAYQARYYGDLARRDGAYHQGTVWAWLIGPFVDAWRRVHGHTASPAHFTSGIVDHLGEACIGSVSEIFDAEGPYTPRGCISQAWSVAEALRLLVA